MALSDLISHQGAPRLRTDLVVEYGDLHDFALEAVVLTETGSAIEIGYYAGDAKPKNIIDISTQKGCPQRCVFCELHDRPFEGSLSVQEMYEEVVVGLGLASERGVDIDDRPHKIDFGKSGEPLLNPSIVDAVEQMTLFGCSYKMCTIFPKSEAAQGRFKALAKVKHCQPVQMQVSLISTSEQYRQRSTTGKVGSFAELRGCGEFWAEHDPYHRKINLSLIVTQNTPCDPAAIKCVLPPEVFNIRLRPYIPNSCGRANNCVVLEPEKLRWLQAAFRDNGYEVSAFATPTPTEQRFGLTSNVTLRRYHQMKEGKF